MEDGDWIKFMGVFISALISALIALIVSRRNSDAAENRFKTELEQAERKLRSEFALEHSLENAIQTLMSKGFALRSFSLIRHHIRGFEDDELKQLLVKSGCICFKVIKGKEYWGLLSENDPLLKERQAMERKGMRFYDLSSEDVESDPDGANA
ncbi:hypothetical protein [Oceanicoccus sp. KOV_DT_Chl]|uniref:hypothetical protein n=1 Tax=Oceanicoccus sp. KOV_DT_Chl TaxID=1904639 RepID=UPI000C79D4A5|nr:hypothetical protein [Oceanicoccus sp. KOV_DT_Chl]